MTSLSAIGALVRYCGHNGLFIADIVEVEGAVCVRANGPVTPANLERPAQGATHHLVDFPKAGLWQPDRGIFVVPAAQVRKL